MNAAPDIVQGFMQIWIRVRDNKPNTNWGRER